MSTHAYKKPDNKHLLVTREVTQQKPKQEAVNSPQSNPTNTLQEMTNRSQRMQEATELQSIADDHSIKLQQPNQKKEYKKGFPNALKTGMEILSGVSLDDVNVHQNSDKPAQLQAHAYAQGTDIHLAPNQEKHLPHELWHVVQQKQGRVKPTTQLSGRLPINDNKELEKEADVMGAKALNFSPNLHSPINNKATQESGTAWRQSTQLAAEVVQRVRIESKGINGLTHLVKMTNDGHIYTKENWLENEREEVKTGDQLQVDMDDAWYSHRGINQETNWQRDGEGEQDHLWVRVIELNHTPVEDGLYVREEMLSDGWAGWTETQKKMHSIWVQGDVTSNEEAMDGLQSRRGKDTEDWVDMLWFYDSGVAQDEYKPQALEIDSKKIAPLLTRSFKHEMVLWKESGTMPEWVENWLPILDILYEKQSFVTMSDLMRMIILYYEGGVYLDVKIKVNPQNSSFKDRPMVKINAANFYSSENWAIIAHAGSKMLEEMMIRAYDQFPKAIQLEEYPTNYQQEHQQDGRKEGKMHVELHERFGVWNVIEQKGRPQFPTSLSLTNPRPVNSWSNAYEDRPPEVVKQEQIEYEDNELRKLQRTREGHERNLEQLKHNLEASRIKSFWQRLGLTQEIVDELPKKIGEEQREIHSITLRIDLKQMDLDQLRRTEDDENREEQVGDDEMDELMRRLNAL